MSDLREIALDEIKENPEAIRVVNRQSEQYLGIVDSIRAKGFRGTITVRGVEGGGYVVVEGMHRYMAAKDAGLEVIPCDVATMDEASAVEYSIMGNVHRKDTSASEYRSGLIKLLNLNPMMTEADLATKLGKSPTWIGNILRLNKIENEQIMALIDDGSITLSNAYALAKLPTEEQLSFLTDAQTLSPEEFLPRVADRVNEIRDAKRTGKDPQEAEFIPAEWMQKLGVIKENRDSGEIGELLIAETNAKTAMDGFILALNWCLHADPFSIQEQRVKWEATQAERAAKRKQKEAENAAKAKLKAEAKLKEAAEKEAALMS